MLLLLFGGAVQGTGPTVFAARVVGGAEFRARIVDASEAATPPEIGRIRIVGAN